MKLVIQRVKNAQVEVDEKVVGKIQKGFLVLLGVTHDDTEKEADYLAKKLCKLRVFEDENDKMNLSVTDIGGEALVISQFTLCADLKKGNRPSFINALEPVAAKNLYMFYCEKLREYGIKKVDEGIFGADMQVELINDGPVTILYDTDIWRKNGN